MTGDGDGLAPSFEFKTRLLVDDVEAATKSARVYLRDGWISTGSLTVDLRKVEFADYIALARLIGLIEGVRRRNIDTDVLLPSASLLPKEEAFLARADEAGDEDPSLASAAAQTRNRPARRRRVRDFMSTTDFVHLVGAVGALVDGAEVGADSSRTQSVAMPDTEQSLLPLLMPFRFCSGLGELAHIDKTWRNLSKLVVSQGGRFLSAASSAAITQALFGELVDNVEEHSALGEPSEIAAPRGVVGALVLRRGLRFDISRRLSRSDELQGYLDWVAASEAPVIRLVVVDSGAGLSETVADEYERRHGSRGTSVDRSLFALSVLGSRHGTKVARKRGTRGLARTVRYVRESEGAVLVRSGNSLAGYCFPERKRVEVREERVPYAPGTAVELLLPVVRRSYGVAGATPIPGTRVDERSEFAIVPFDPRATPEVVERLDELVDDASTPLVMPILMPTHWDLESNEIEQLYFDLASITLQFEGSCLMSLVNPFPGRQLATAGFQTVDDARENSTRGALESVEIPVDAGIVLVVEPDNRYRFYGGSASTRRLLYRLAEWEPVDNHDRHEIRRLQSHALPGRHWIDTSSEPTLALRPSDVLNFSVGHARAQALSRALSVAHA